VPSDVVSRGLSSKKRHSRKQSGLARKNASSQLKKMETQRSEKTNHSGKYDRKELARKESVGSTRKDDRRKLGAPRQSLVKNPSSTSLKAATQRQGATLNQFKLMSNLGDGAYSKVYKVKRIADGQQYALKMVAMKNLSDKEKDNAINEVRILASIRNPNIISYKEAFVDKNSESLCIIMELVDMGDLYGQIVKSLKRQGSTIPQAELEYEGLKEDFIWRVFIQVVKGLKSMHDLNIMHRDLKSANVFLNSDDSVKLGDMNVSKVASKDGLNFTQTGTPYYASPEVWRDEPYDIKSDIWSLGCVLYEMITLKPPFQSSSMKGLFKKVCNGRI
jgi:NIMA (never in mitosis gene a)-related kinase 1/4/5